MTRSEALTKLQVMAQWQLHPKLELAELDFCLDAAQRGEAEWNLNFAAREAWLLKAGKAADHHTSTVAGRRFEANQVYDNCQRQARLYAARLNGTMEVGS